MKWINAHYSEIRKYYFDNILTLLQQKVYFDEKAWIP
jgi:ABC-type phosphate/phosphonate transport system ATPase subunit